MLRRRGARRTAPSRHAGYGAGLEDPTQTLGPFQLNQRLESRRGALYAAVGARGERAVVRTVRRGDHASLDAALVGVRFAHPHLEYILDAGIDQGVGWVAREDIPSPWDPTWPWTEQARHAHAALDVLGMLDAVGCVHGRVSAANLQLRDGHIVLVDAGGEGCASGDLRALGRVLARSEAAAPDGYRSFVERLGAGHWDRAVDAMQVLESLGVSASTATAPSTPPRTLLPLRPAPLWGRDEELERLAAVVGRASQGCQVAVVVSRPGLAPVGWSTRWPRMRIGGAP